MPRTIDLTRGFVTTVDDEDFAQLSAMKWTYLSGYAANWYRVGKKVKHLYMHRLLTNAKPGEEVDHIDGNPLNNQRHNLRVCSRQENSRNTHPRKITKSGYKGVTPIPSGRTGRRWIAKLCENKQILYLGCFPTPEDAARAYDIAARKHYGEFARTNFPI